MAGSDWSFNIRSSYAYGDSDSEEEGPARSTSRTEPDSDPFDLTTRDGDTVQYKPNPFSIAKINAACRAQRSLNAEPADASHSYKKPQPAVHKLTNPIPQVPKTAKQQSIPADSTAQCEQVAAGRQMKKLGSYKPPTKPVYRQATIGEVVARSAKLKEDKRQSPARPVTPLEAAAVPAPKTAHTSSFQAPPAQPVAEGGSKPTSALHDLNYFAQNFYYPASGRGNAHTGTSGHSEAVKCPNVVMSCKTTSLRLVKNLSYASR
ncbi:hypothetical protein D9611_008562 [Ephemerocybe angulata]|uniref:Uncharacterized protein n=1 Tax=Ephemerocybe angulata TaxID=980116 RepID=A0A8H5EV72_9AGAR|nr:hypothetical protein D9611_008562 [Tulosesus angulatus]